MTFEEAYFYGLIDHTSGDLYMVGAGHSTVYHVVDVRMRDTWWNQEIEIGSYYPNASENRLLSFTLKKFGEGSEFRWDVQVFHTIDQVQFLRKLPR